MLRFLGEHRFSRSDVVVALGGGVVGDLAGFAAATYQRGMGFAQIDDAAGRGPIRPSAARPPSFLPTGKNQAGSFYQPCIVICDPNTLKRCRAVPLRLRRDHQVFDARQYGVAEDSTNARA